MASSHWREFAFSLLSLCSALSLAVSHRRGGSFVASSHRRSWPLHPRPPSPPPSINLPDTHRRACQEKLTACQKIRHTLTTCPTVSERVDVSNTLQHMSNTTWKHRLQFLHWVTELRKKGIKFRKREVESFQNIQFKDGTIKIPWLVILDTTRSLFLNLVAFEQCHFNCGNDINLFFMDDLIDFAEDVRHLHDCGIMRHTIGSDTEVVDFILVLFAVFYIYIPLDDLRL